MIEPIKTLLQSSLDYAGLFPPAQLDLQTAMEQYDRAQSSPYCWFLGRFVLPASALQEFEQRQGAFPQTQWSLSVILTPAWETEFQAHPSLMRHIEAVEIPPRSPLEMEQLLLRLPVGVEAFFEVPLQEISAYLRMLKQMGVGAKIRTGGITPDAFPSVEALSQGLLAIAKANIPFKATAGLHHPVPGAYPISSERPSVKMHGFLNVAIAAALIHEYSLSQVADILQEPTFQITSDAIIWRDFTLSLAAIAKTRQQFFRSFGSCSFDEPIHDLIELNLL